MDFRRRNINKVQRNGELIAYNVSSFSSKLNGGSSSSSNSGSYLPATNNGDGTYTVDLTSVLFNGNVIAAGEVAAYLSGNTDASGSTTVGNVVIEDNLTSTATTAALSANQGRILKDLINEVSGKTSGVTSGTTGETVTELSKLKDVLISNPSNNQIIQYDSYSAKWVNKNLNTEVSALTQHINDKVIHITETDRTNWDNKLNKSVWDDIFEVDSNGNLKVKVNLYGQGEISAYGSGTTGSTTEINLENYYTKDEIDDKLDNLDIGDIDLSDYSKTSHTHSNYALSNHTHAQYSPTSHTHNYVSTIKVGTTNYNASANTISLPAYPTISTLGAASSTDLNNHTANTTAHITAAERTNWNAAYTNNHTHSNKSVIDGITSTKVTNWDKVVTDWSKIFEIDSNGNLRVKVNLYGDKEISAYGSGTSGGSTEINLENYYTKSEIDDKLDNIDVGDIDLSDYSKTSHTHSNYALSNHTHTNYSVTSHTHAQYASSSHTHSISNITNLQSTLDGKSGTGHSHSNYSLTSHTHSAYAGTGHSHSNYATTTNFNSHSGNTTLHITAAERTAWNAKSDAHSHPYASSSHTHSNYSVTSHTHSYVPLSASTTTLVSNAQSGVINFNSTASDTGIRLYNGGNNKGGVWWGSTTGMYLYNTASAKYIGVLDNGTPYYFDGTSNRTLVHSNNSGHTHNYAGSSSAGGAATSANKVNSTLSFSAGTFSANSFNGSAAKTVYVPTHTSHITNNSGFITSGATVAAANKLATSRTLWGQSFNGTANVTGNITGSYFKINDTSSNPYLQLTQGATWYIQGYNNYLYLGAGSTKSLRVDATGNCLSVGEVTAHSDERLKDNIQPLTNRGYITPRTYIKDGKESIGFIAQDMQKLYPELVTVDESTEEKYLTVNYMQYTAVLQAQIIELSKEIQELKDKLNDIYNKE